MQSINQGSAKKRKAVLQDKLGYLFWEEEHKVYWPLQYVVSYAKIDQLYYQYV